MNKKLSEELIKRINIRLQELWKTDKDLLISLVIDRKSREIYDLFKIKEMSNGWELDDLTSRYNEQKYQIRWNNNYYKYQYETEKRSKDINENKKWERIKLKWEVFPSLGFLRKKRLQRSYSLSDIGTENKTEEYPFFMEKWNLGSRVKIEIPEFLKLKIEKKSKMDRTRRNNF